MDQVPLQTGWIKIWVAIGTVVMACIIILPPVLIYGAQQDVQRYQECMAGKRRDCQRTIVWNLVDMAAQLQAQDGGTSASSLSAYDLNQTTQAMPPSRSSENAPTIQKVEPRGMTNPNGTYHATVGSTVTFVATITGGPVTVEGYLITADGGTPTKPTMTFKKQKDGTWLSTYKIPPGLQGQMEIRATGDDPKDRASLYLLVAAN